MLNAKTKGMILSSFLVAIIPFMDTHASDKSNKKILNEHKKDINTMNEIIKRIHEEFNKKKQEIILKLKTETLEKPFNLQYIKEICDMMGIKYDISNIRSIEGLFDNPENYINLVDQNEAPNVAKERLINDFKDLLFARQRLIDLGLRPLEELKNIAEQILKGKNFEDQIDAYAEAVKFQDKIYSGQDSFSLTEKNKDVIQGIVDILNPIDLSEKQNRVLEGIIELSDKKSKNLENAIQGLQTETIFFKSKVYAYILRNNPIFLKFFDEETKEYCQDYLSTGNPKLEEITENDTVPQKSKKAFDFISRFYNEQSLKGYMTKKPIDLAEFIEKLNTRILTLKIFLKQKGYIQGKTKDEDLDSQSKHLYGLEKMKKNIIKFGFPNLGLMDPKIVDKKSPLQEAGYDLKEMIDGTGYIACNKNKLQCYIVYGGMLVGKQGAGTWQEVEYESDNIYANGSSQIMNWNPTIPDFMKFSLKGEWVNWLSGGVYRGFYDRFDQSWNSNYNFIYNFAKKQGKHPKDFRYIIIGHSMGGGSAQLAGLRLAKMVFEEKPKKKIQVFAFGTPGLMSPFFAKKYNEILGENQTINIINTKDDTSSMTYYKIPLNDIAGFCRGGFIYITPETKKRDKHSAPAYEESLEIWLTTKQQTKGTKCSMELKTSAWIFGDVGRFFTRKKHFKPYFIEELLNNENNNVLKDIMVKYNIAKIKKEDIKNMKTSMFKSFYFASIKDISKSGDDIVIYKADYLEGSEHKIYKIQYLERTDREKKNPYCVLASQHFDQNNLKEHIKKNEKSLLEWCQ